jgi:hypothetical protein
VGEKIDDPVMLTDAVGNELEARVKEALAGFPPLS